MASLKSKVSKYLEDNSKTYDNERHNIFLQNDGSGDYIKTWNVSGLVKPNDSQLNSYNSAADTAETLNNLLYKFFNNKDGMFSPAIEIVRLATDMSDEEINNYSNDEIFSIAISVSNFVNKKKVKK